MTALTETAAAPSDLAAALAETMGPDVNATVGAPPIAPTPSPTTLPALRLGAAADGEPVDLEIVGLLGEGGMGIVELARQPSLDRDVALKRVRREIDDARAVRALLDEARVMGSLEHPGIVPVHALGRDRDARPVIVMKRVEGVTWRDLVLDPAHPRWTSVGPDRLGFHLGVFLQVCNAIHFAHARGVLHRDLKPDNVMIGEYGEVYVLDWGIAIRKRALDGEPLPLAGTPAYMAPEMIDASIGPLGDRTDVYLLGAVLHELLTGRAPHLQATMRDTLTSALVSAPPIFDDAVPAELGAICRRAMSRDPAARHATVEELRRAVAAFLEHRASIELTMDAIARLAELRALIDDAGADRFAVHKVFGECAFGFRTAIRSWPENGRAKDGLAEALGLMAAHEIAQRHEAAASILLAELPSPRPDLEEALARLREELARERADVERLQGIARDLDLGVGARQRALLSLAQSTGITVLAVVSGALERRGVFTLDYPIAIGLLGIVMLLTLVIAIRGRATLKANRMNLQLALSIFLVSPLAMLVTLILGAYAGVDVRRAMAISLLGMVPQIALLGVWMYPRVASLAPIGLAASFAAIAWPTYLIDIVGGTIGLIGMLGGLEWRRLAAAAEAKR